MMSKTPRTVRPVGFDNDFIMTKIRGKSQSEINDLYWHGVLGKWKDQQGRRPPADWDQKSGVILRR